MNKKKDQNQPKFALVIVNWDYYGSNFMELLYPEQDGKCMEKTLETAGYRQVKVVNNVRDIQGCVKDYLDEFQLIEMERFHFHYSGNQSSILIEKIKFIAGHGVFNACIEFNQHILQKSADETVYMSTDTVGDCMVGVRGKLYSVMDLKHQLLKLKSERWTISLDMCRDARGGMLQKVWLT